MKALVVGCSVAKGHGLDGETRDLKLWANQFLNHVAPGCEIVNLSTSGKNNHWIFTEACSELIKNKYDIAIVAWTHQARLNFTFGLEKYETGTMLKETDRNISLNPNVTLTGKFLKNIGDQLRKLQNDHWMLLDLVKYVNILYDIQVNSRKSRLICINSLMSLSTDYFVEKKINTPDELSEYQQSILNVDTRDDDEVKEIYKMTHEHYRYYGGIKPEIWLNLYHSLFSMQVDNVSDVDIHPGYQSQDVYAKYLINQFYETSNNSNQRRS